MNPDTNGHMKNKSGEELYRKIYTDSIILCGLHNIGNTCYFNSGLQCLCTCFPFIAALEFMTPPLPKGTTFTGMSKVSGEISSPASPSSQSSSLWSRLLAQKKVSQTHYHVWAEVQNFISCMKVTDELCLNPVFLIDALATAHPQFEGLFQQDCAEMIHQVLSSLDDCTRVDWYPEDIDCDSSPISPSSLRLLAVYRLMVQINEENREKHFKVQERKSAEHAKTPYVISPFVAPRLFSSPLCDPFRGYLLNCVRCHKCGESSRVIHDYTSLSLELPSMTQRARYAAEHPEFVSKMEERFCTNEGSGGSGMKGWYPFYNRNRSGKRFNLFDTTTSINKGYSPQTIAVVVFNFSRWLAGIVIGFPNRLMGTSLHSRGLIGSVWSWMFSKSDPKGDDFDDTIYNRKTGKVYDTSLVTYPLTLDECLGIHFSPETLRGQNKYLCESCGERSTATKQQVLLTVPELLTIQLNRFDYHRRWTTKKYDEVIFHVPEYPLSSCDVNNDSSNYTMGNTVRKSSVDPRTIQELEKEYLSLSYYMGDGGCLFTNNNTNKVSVQGNPADACSGSDGCRKGPSGRQTQYIDPIADISANQYVDEMVSRFTIIPPAPRTTYGLISVVNHQGSGAGGHYTSYCLKGTEEIPVRCDAQESSGSDTVRRIVNKWVMFNDERLGVIPASQVANSEGYLFIFKKQDVCRLDTKNDRVGYGDRAAADMGRVREAEAAARRRAQQILMHSPLSRNDYNNKNQTSSSHKNNKRDEFNGGDNGEIIRVPRAWLVAVATSLEPGPLSPPKPSSSHSRRLCPNYEPDWYYVEVDGNDTNGGMTMEDYEMFRKVFGGR